MRLRKAVRSDIREITELWKDMTDIHQGQDSYFTLDEDAKAAYQKYAEENIRNEGKYFKVCLNDKNELMGYLLADTFEYPPVYPIKRYMEIIEIVVRKDQRRKCIGKFMLQDVLDWAKEKGNTRVECKVAAANPISQGKGDMLEEKKSKAEISSGKISAFSVVHLRNLFELFMRIIRDRFDAAGVQILSPRPDWLRPEMPFRPGKRLAHR